MSETILGVENVEAWYGDAKVLHGLSFELKKGEVLSLIGANGAGKSTLLKCLCGLLPRKAGLIRFHGHDIGALAANEIVARGIALVPEGRRLFPSLSVEENLILGGQVKRPGPWTLRPSMACSRSLRKNAARRPHPCPAGNSRWWRSAAD